MPNVLSIIFMQNIASILLQSGGAAAYGQLIILVLMFAVFYFFMILPQQRKQRKQKEFVDSLEKGQNVVTAGGMHGKIVGIEGHTVILEVDRGIKVRFEKGSISFENTEALKPVAGESKKTES